MTLPAIYRFNWNFFMAKFTLPLSTLAQLVIMMFSGSRSTLAQNDHACNAMSHLIGVQIHLQNLVSKFANPLGKFRLAIIDTFWAITFLQNTIH